MLEAKKVHVIGIGGVGTSALAQWLRAMGLHVEGSDASRSVITDALIAHGIAVTIGTPPELSDDIDLIIFSDAVPEDHALRQWATTHGIMQKSYATILGEVANNYRLVAIAGSHGKSTTTSLTGLLLTELGLDPTVLVGTIVPTWHVGGFLGNWRAGKSNICVVEADEYNYHFHHLRPEVAVVTSLDHDHVDIFPTPLDYHVGFQKFLAATTATPVLEKHVQEQLADFLQNRQVLSYGVAVNADLTATPPRFENGRQIFSISYQGVEWGEFSLRVPGVHMVADLLAAVGVALQFEFDHEQVQEALRCVVETFTGTWRRFECIGELKEAPTFSDYAHHPTEVAALIDAAHQFYADRRLVLVFQPHQHARTLAFDRDFINVFRQKLRPTDQLVLAEVYGVLGRDENDQRATTQSWPQQIGSHAAYVAQLAELDGVLAETVKPNDIVVFAGAGTIDSVARALVAAGS